MVNIMLDSILQYLVACIEGQIDGVLGNLTNSAAEHIFKFPTRIQARLLMKHFLRNTIIKLNTIEGLHAHVLSSVKNLKEGADSGEERA